MRGKTDPGATEILERQCLKSEIGVEISSYKKRNRYVPNSNKVQGFGLEPIRNRVRPDIDRF